MRKGTALVVGATGITGGNLASYLIASGWAVYGLSRRPSQQAGIIPVAADLLDAEATRAALAGLDISHVFFCTWTRRENEAENVKANGAMMNNLFAALDAERLQHVALVTGTKHYLGSFENYGSGTAETPFRESEPRVPGDNFYYTLEDIMYEAAERYGFSWNVHRPHTVIGYARDNAMNIGVTLGIYASICKATGRKFIFPGSQVQWNGLTDMSDALLLARQMEWAALSPGAQNQAFNSVNGDVFRWRWMWQQIADFFGVESGGCPETPAPLAEQMKDVAPEWARIVEQHGLVDTDIERVSWWHTDADLGREVECLNDMTKSRDFGFDGYRDTRAALLDLFTRLRAERIIP